MFAFNAGSLIAILIGTVCAGLRFSTELEDSARERTRNLCRSVTRRL